MRQKFESNEQIQKMDPEKREALIQGQAKFAGIAGSVMGPIALILTVLISAALFKGLFSVMDATMPFKSGFAVTWYAMVPSMLSILLSIGVMFLKDPGDFDLEHPLAFNVGAFLNKETTGKFLYRLATSLDLFVIWLVALMGLGYSVATGGKVSAGKSIGTVTVVWLVLILAMAGIASLMPGLSSQVGEPRVLYSQLMLRRSCLIGSVCLLFAGLLPARTPITHESMWTMKRVSAPAVSPDGKWVVFAVAEPSYDEKEQRSDLWLVPADGSAKPPPPDLDQSRRVRRHLEPR